jgi:hypothetical protein
MSSKTRFDLEQEIMSCWNITTDLDVVYQAEHLYDDENAMQNALLGLMSLYELKFAKLWATFESCVETAEFDARVTTPVSDHDEEFWDN